MRVSYGLQEKLQKRGRTNGDTLATSFNSERVPLEPIRESLNLDSSFLPFLHAQRRRQQHVAKSASWARSTGQRERPRSRGRGKTRTWRETESVLETWATLELAYSVTLTG